MISAVAGEPAEGLHQFRSQFYAAGVDLETALKNLALATDNIEKAAGGLSVENSAAFIFDFFKTAAPALLAAAVPFRIFCGVVSHRLFLTLLSPGS